MLNPRMLNRSATVTEERCVWVYAVAADAEPPFTGGMIGVGGGAVRPLTAAGLMAITGDVPVSGFGEAALRRNLEDLDWLEQTARTHHAVIEAVAKERTVVPMRLATVYRSDEGVTGMLRERAADFREALARVTARSEWGVKAYTAMPPEQGPPEQGPPEQGAPEQGQPPEAGQAPLGPGAAYLRRRRAQLAARSDARQQALTSARAIYEDLGRLCVAARVYPPQPAELAGRSASMVLNAAYLVADERAEDFAAAVTGLAAAHPSVRLALTGPWPPYSFAGQPGAESGEPESRPEAGDFQ
jgi:Gas vesicle synthesis protein GvpL/GvpF